MDSFRREESRCRSLPQRLVSTLRSLSFHRLPSRSSLAQRRNAISAESYNEVRKGILDAPLPTTILQRAPTKEFSLGDLDLPLAASSSYILFFVNQCSTLLLFNVDGELYRLDLSETLVLIHDLCWSTKRNEFFLGGYSFYTFDPRRCRLSLTDEIRLSRGERVISVTCNEQFVYLLVASRSVRLECRWLFRLSDIRHRWLESDVLRSSDFLVQSIRVNLWNILGMLIKDKTGHWRVDLFHANHLSRLVRGRTLGLGIPGLRSCFLLSVDRQWLVSNHCFRAERLILLDENGRVKSKVNVDISHFNLCSMGKDFFVLNSKDRLRLYRIE